MSISALFDRSDALALAEHVRKGDVSPSELLEEAARRIEKTRQLNAVVTSMIDVARKNIDRGLPDGPFRGVPFLLKDLAAQYAGVPLQNGSRLWRNNVPSTHSELVVRLEKAGFVICGKTNTSEWGILPTCETKLYGPCHNPWKMGFTSGGSSGGAASAVGARVVPIAHGGDAGGSIRIPASCCGIFGLKPTRGRNPFGPDTSERAHGLAAEHAVTLTVRDSAALLDATAGPESTAPYFAPPKTGAYLEDTQRAPKKLRIGFTSQPVLPAAPDAQMGRAVDDAVRLLGELGHEVFEAKLPVDGSEMGKHFFTLYASSAAGEVELAEKKLGRSLTLDDVEVTTMMMSLIGRKIITGGQLSAAIRELQAASRAIARFHENVDVFLTPTLGRAPVEHGALLAKGMEAKVQEVVAKNSLAIAMKLPGVLEKAIARAYGFAPYTQIANVTGQPSMSVPLFFEAGLPIGVCFTSRFGDEPTLFQLAAQLEQARPWRDVVPPINALSG